MRCPPRRHLPFQDPLIDMPRLALDVFRLLEEMEVGCVFYGDMRDGAVVSHRGACDETAAAQDFAREYAEDAAGRTVRAHGIVSAYRIACRRGRVWRCGSKLRADMFTARTMNAGGGIHMWIEEPPGIRLHRDGMDRADVLTGTAAGAMFLLLCKFCQQAFSKQNITFCHTS